MVTTTAPKSGTNEEEPMDLTMLNDAARAVHLLGLALGFGVAILADLSAARLLVRPLDGHEVETLHRYHRTVAMGLALFWASGLVLLWLRTGFQVESFSPKLMAKLGIVTLLTVNAIMIGRIGLAVLRDWHGVRFGAIPFAERTRLSALAGLSGAGWISALALGVFSKLKTVEWATLSEVIGVIYLLALVAAMAAAFLSPVLNYAMDRWRSRPEFF
ncbi:MAG: hypothetical protein HKN18_03560 [Silicimonas sp.]|nr:hypothetical protein [Silicimonas sp.]